jgi:hypothetical protein
MAAGSTARETGGLMNCDRIAESISALCDGETISRDTAEHIGACEVCRSRLNAYAAMSAELRRVASLEDPANTGEPSWKSYGFVRPNWSRKVGTTMKIPRLAFASMLTLILALGSGLAILKARPAPSDKILLLTAKLQSGSYSRCALLIGAHEHPPCVTILGEERRVVGMSFRILSSDGNRIQLAVRSKVAVSTVANSAVESARQMSSADAKDWPEKDYWFDPGQQLQITLGDGEMVSLSGEVSEEMPAYGPDPKFVPQTNEFRVWSPVLIRDKQVIFDSAGTGYFSDAPESAVTIYSPSYGRYVISTVPFRDAVEGSVEDNRIRFTLNGQEYILLTLLPSTRSEHVWVSRDPQYKPSEHEHGASDAQPMVKIGGLPKLLQE